MTNSKQEIRKLLRLSQVTEIDIPVVAADAPPTEAYSAIFMFTEECKQRPFRVFFADAEQRVAFSDQMISKGVLMREECWLRIN